MMSEANKELYGETFIPDPVTKGAVEAAMAATEPSHLHSPWWKRFTVSFAIILFTVAAGSSIVTAVNAVQNTHQNSKLSKQNAQLQAEQACLVTLVQSFEKDQNARVLISKDDRDVIDDLVQAAFKAKTPQDVQKALNSYNARRKQNESRRKSLPVLAPSCNLTISTTKAPETKLPISPSPAKTPSLTLPSSTPSKSTSSSVSSTPTKSTSSAASPTLKESIAQARTTPSVNMLSHKPSNISTKVSTSVPSYPASSSVPKVESSTAPSPLVPIGPALCGLVGLCLN